MNKVNQNKTLKCEEKAVSIIKKLKEEQYGEAFADIMTMILEFPDFAEPHNLLGIWNELQGNYDLARKHYRAGYALNPAYSPVSNNLERLCMDYQDKNHEIDYGEKILKG